MSINQMKAAALNTQYAGRIIKRLVDDEVNYFLRSGIITDIVHENKIAYAVILWDEDSPYEDMLVANSDDSFEDLSVQGAVEKVMLNQILVKTSEWDLK